MRVLLLVNNRLGRLALEWFVEKKSAIAAVVVHEEARRTEGPAIVAAVRAAGIPLLTQQQLDGADIGDRIRGLQIDVGLSVNYGHILRRSFIDLIPNGIYNLHAGLLPYNRGTHTNVWSIVEGTPAGVSLHLIDEGVDSGPILAQQAVEVEPIDTGETLYRKLEVAGMELLRHAWPQVVAGKLQPVSQDMNAGSGHRARDLARLDQLDPTQKLTAGEWINWVRARTFPPHRGACLDIEGRRVQVRVQLEYVDDETGKPGGSG